MKQIKKIIGRILHEVEDQFFVRRKKISALELYPKGKNYLFDIINYYGDVPAINILDVGANYGQSALKYHKIFLSSKVYCFEPVKETFEKLEHNTNKIHNIRSFNFALGEKAEEVTIKLNPKSTGLNSLVNEVNKGLDTATFETVKVKTLDDFLVEQKIERVGLLKIDTEGFEMQVLKGAKESIHNKIFDFIYCEVGFRSETHKGQFSEISKYLWEKGYIFSGLYDNYRFGPSNTFVQFSNALFTKHN